MRPAASPRADERRARAAAERAALLEEKRSIFLRNDAVIKAVLSTARGSTLKALLTIALNTARAPLIYARRVPASSLAALALLILALLAALLAMVAASFRR